MATGVPDGPELATWRRFAAWVATVALLLNVVAPAFWPGAPTAASPFDDVPICSAHAAAEDPGDGADGDWPLARTCPLCLLLGHMGAFQPGETAAPFPVGGTAALARPASPFGNAVASVFDSPAIPRAPPSAA